MADELVLEDVTVVLDGDVVEPFFHRLQEMPRIHVRYLAVHGKGPDRKGRMQYHFSPGPDAMMGFKITVPPEHADAADAFLMRVRAAKEAAVARTPPGMVTT